MRSLVRFQRLVRGSRCGDVSALSRLARTHHAATAGTPQPQPLQRGFAHRSGGAHLRAPALWAQQRHRQQLQQAWLAGVRRVHDEAKAATDAAADASKEGKGDAAAEADAAAPDEVTQLRTQLEEAEGKAKENHDMLLRAVAEAENTRKIAQRDVSNATKMGIRSFAKDLLSVLDDYERALTAVADLPPDAEDRLHALNEFVSGVQLCHKELMGTLAKHHLERFDPVGDEFDPNLHEALYQAPHESMPKNTITQTVKVGYKLHDQVIRAAQVGTSSGPPQ